jgi:hypothetical protein
MMQRIEKALGRLTLRAQGCLLSLGVGSLPRIGKRKPMGTQAVIIKVSLEHVGGLPHRYALNPFE